MGRYCVTIRVGIKVRRVTLLKIADSIACQPRIALILIWLSPVDCISPFIKVYMVRGYITRASMQNAMIVNYLEIVYLIRLINCLGYKTLFKVQ